MPLSCANNEQRSLNGRGVNDRITQRSLRTRATVAAAASSSTTAVVVVAAAVRQQQIAERSRSSRC